MTTCLIHACFGVVACCFHHVKTSSLVMATAEKRRVCYGTANEKDEMPLLLVFATREERLYGSQNFHSTVSLK